MRTRDAVIGGKMTVGEITNGRHYTVTAADGQVIGEDVVAWVARVIVACEDDPPYVTVADRFPPLEPPAPPAWRGPAPGRGLAG
jgi:hypothetical protein